jgi:exonuclease VII large subunit
MMEVHSKSLVNRKSQGLTNQADRLIRISPVKIREELLKLDQTEMQLKLVDPLNVLRRGYAIVTNENGVLSAKNIAETGQELKVTTEAQELKAKVK